MLPDERVTDDWPTSKRPRWPFGVLGAVVLLVVLAVVVFAVLLGRVKLFDSYDCAGVAMDGKPEAPTPAAAFEAYVSQIEQRDGVTIDRSKWHQVGDGFESEDRAAVPMGKRATMWSVDVAHKPNGLYTVSGACTGHS